MKTKETALLTGITVRTLQYYDKIGLLKPSKHDENKYRDYTLEDLETLKQILFFRELDFPLVQIKEIMQNPGYKKMDALAHHKELLQMKRDRLNRIIELVDQSMRGENHMNFEAFQVNDFLAQKDAYAKEVKERWGNTDSYFEYQEKSKKYTKDGWSKITSAGNEILKGFASLSEHHTPDSPEVQVQVAAWQNYISQNFYTCTKTILSGLGKMYVADERFKKNIDQFKVGTAEFLAKAIEYYCR